MLPTITCKDLQDWKTSGKAFLHIDVREQDEWDDGHIEGATHIPMGILPVKIGEVAPNKDSLIVLQCRSGGRSGMCTQQLMQMGYTNVFNLEGGYDEYCNMTK